MIKGAYYNEHDPYCCAWLRNLIKHNLIPPGDVDSRDIQEVHPLDVDEYTQVHLFAGLGGWAYALTLAQWPDDRPIWTGSCPCQPFSVAGKGQGTSDPRHLWPHFFRLLVPHHPSIVMGEQVSGAAGYTWFDGVASDLEGEGYSCRTVDIPSCAVNAPHRRNRLYWLVHSSGEGSPLSQQKELRGEGWREERGTVTEPSEPVSGVDNSSSSRFLQAELGETQEVWDQARSGEFERRSGDGVDGMGNPQCQRNENHGPEEIIGTSGTMQSISQERERIWSNTGQPSNSSNFWDNYQLIGPDKQGFYRRIGLDWSTQSPIRLLVNGVSRRVVVGCSRCSITREIPGDDLDETLHCPNCKKTLPHIIREIIEPSRVSLLRALGNAINPELAAEVIRAWMDVAP